MTVLLLLLIGTAKKNLATLGHGEYPKGHRAEHFFNMGLQAWTPEAGRCCSCCTCQQVPWACMKPVSLLMHLLLDWDVHQCIRIPHHVSMQAVRCLH